jgi:gluconokinase
MDMSLDGLGESMEVRSMPHTVDFPCSVKEEIDGLPYFLRMCDKIRLNAAGNLHSDYHANLGKAMDLWTCQLLKIEYAELVQFITETGADDRAALDWCYANGEKPESPVKDWWVSYITNCGYRDRLSEKLEVRKADAGLAHRDDITTFFDYMDAEEGY